MPRVIDIHGRRLGDGHPCYVIAEAGSNHDGSLDQAVRLIDVAARAGADAVKFQAIRFDELWVPALETDERRAFYTAVGLPEDWLPRLQAESQQRGIHFLCSPTYLRSVALIDQAGAPAFKVASPQAIGDPLILRAVGRLGKPVILSSGYADVPLIERALAVLREAGAKDIVLLHCVARYPLPVAEANLRAIGMLAERFGVPVGLSDHTIGIEAPLAAVALGACVVEKHFTTDRSRPGPDHHFALEPQELADLVRGIRAVESALGTGARELSAGNEPQRQALQVRAIASATIPAGTVIDDGVLTFRRAPAGIPAWDADSLRGAVARTTIPAWTPITPDKIRMRTS